MENRNENEDNTKSTSPQNIKLGPFLQGGCLSAGIWTGGTAANWRNHSTISASIKPSASRDETSPSPQLALPSADSSNASPTSSPHSSTSPRPSSDQSLHTTSEEISVDRSERGGSLPAKQLDICSFPSPTSSSIKSLQPAATTCGNGERNLQAFLKAIDQKELSISVSDRDKLKILEWLKDTKTTNEDVLNNDEVLVHSPLIFQSPSPSAMSCSEFPCDDQERIQRLLASRDSLSLKVAMLTKQVAQQRDKIHEMEEILKARRNGEFNQNGNEAATQSIEPIAQELANLRHKNMAAEREKLEAEQRLSQCFSNNELEPVVSEKEPLKKTKRSKNNNDGSSLNRQELERLQIAIQRLLADNEQKDSQIQSLRSALEHRKRGILNGSDSSTSPLPSYNLQQSPPDINEQIRRILLSDENGQQLHQNAQHMAHSNSFPLSLCSTVACSSQQKSPLIYQHHHQQQQNSHQQQYQQSFPAFLPMSNSFSFALGSQHQQVTAYTPPLWRVSSPPSVPPHLSHSPRARQLAAELDELRRSGAVNPVASTGIHHPPQYSSASLPRSIHSKSNSLSTCTPKLTYQLPPNVYGESDDEISTRFSTSVNSHQNGNTYKPSSNNKKEKRGRRPRSTLRSFLGRFAHRGNSLQDLRPSPRFPSPVSFLTTNASDTSLNSKSICLNPSIRQFVEWDGQKCDRWLRECGFDTCPTGVVHSGCHLVNMTDKDYERDLNIKSSLQRKRLKCLLTKIEKKSLNGEIKAPDRFDTNQVMVWLDLIGLPQYRDLFANYRMDGRLLLELSAHDLLELGIYSALNHASLARAIQFLRSAEFYLHRLEEHFNADSLSRMPIPDEVERWSHGCTLGWLCSIDLSEFTQNLAFSGVHGALLVLEPTFTAESLAELLQIPVQKTLLRRHLTTQFNTLLGQKVITHKRDVVSQAFVTHLTPSLRIKLVKKGIGVGFSLPRKKSKSDIFVEPEVRVCPTETNGSSAEASSNV